MKPVARLFAFGCVVSLGVSLSTAAPADPPPAGEITGTVSASVAKNRANTVVFIKNAGLGTSNATALMDQVGMIFSPRVLPVQKGTTVKFKNSDPTGHNVFTPDNEKYDLGTWPTGEVREHTFAKPGVYRQLCRVHDDMIAFIVVLDTKYFAVSDKSGRYKIGNLPPGKYTVGVWNEKLGAKDADIEVAAGKPATLDITLGPK